MKVKLTKEEFCRELNKYFEVMDNRIYKRDSCKGLPDFIELEAEPVETEGKSYMVGGGGSGGSNYGYQLPRAKIEELDATILNPGNHFFGMVFRKINELIRAWNSQ